MIIAENGKSQWHIVMPHPTDETTKYAADELHDYLMRISGVSLPVQTDQMPRSEFEILIGWTNRQAAELGQALIGLGEEGFVILAEEKRIQLAGNSPRGTLYAIYTLLEDYLGCRWYASDCSYVPKTLLIRLPEILRREKPAFESREAYWRDAFDGPFAVRNKMNSNKADISVRQGGHLKFHRFHHTFDEIVPVKRYFDEHPEYFSMVGGKRIKEDTQLCLTNPEVLKLTVAKVKDWIAENLDCTVFSVAQNDCGNPCDCPACRAIDEAEGSHAGTMIRFVNAVSEIISRDCPQVMIHTFAYQHTRKAPRITRPGEHVIVRLCDIECSFDHPLNENKIPESEESAFVNDLREWGKITSHLYVWDYVTNFHNYLMPFPNLRSLQKNLILFKEAGVAGVLEQGDFAHGAGAHLAELEAWLQSKLLWDPYINAEEYLTDFLRGYYGPVAAPLIRAYIKRWEAAVDEKRLGIFDGTDAAYVSSELLTESVEMIGQALFVTENNEQRKRLEKLMLSMEYMLLSRMPEGTMGRNALLAIFGWRVRMAGISELRERWPLEESLEEINRHTGEEQRVHKIHCDYKM